MSTRDEIRDLTDDFTKAFANGDVAGLVSHYTDDAIVLAPNAPRLQGPAEITAGFQAFLDSGLKSIEFETIDVIEEGSLVVEVGNAIVGLETPDGLVEDPSKYVVVYRRQADGSLKIAVDAFSSDTPLPEA